MQSKYFKLPELFPKELYTYLKDLVSAEVMWRMLNPKLTVSIDRLKEKFPEGSISINNYEWDGDREWSGLRTKGSPWYSPTSQHSEFNAVDCVFSAYSTDEVREYILANQDEFPEVTRIEGKVGWLHMDVKYTGMDEILVFYPRA